VAANVWREKAAVARSIRSCNWWWLGLIAVEWYRISFFVRPIGTPRTSVVNAMVRVKESFNCVLNSFAQMRVV